MQGCATGATSTPGPRLNVAGPGAPRRPSLARVGGTRNGRACRTRKTAVTAIRPWSVQGSGLCQAAAAVKYLGLSAPDLCGGFYDEAQLGDLLVIGQDVALDGGGEAALGGQAQLVERDVLGRL